VTNIPSLIDAYTDHVNRLLAETPRTDEREAGERSVVERLLPTCAGDAEQIALLDQLHSTFLAALTPREFFNLRVRAYDTWFHRTYALMARTFGPDVLDEADAYSTAFPEPVDPHKPPNFAMVSRFFRVSGSQQYDDDGRLTRFSFDPQVTTEEITAMASGTYMTLDPLRPGLSLGAIGYAATRPGLRGQGHGNIIVEMFEQEMRAVARARGETLTLILLESEPTSTAFWSRCGYRWPLGGSYVQPPISFDLQTGEPNFPPRLEILMLKLLDSPHPEYIERDVLLDAMKTMLRRWFLPTDAAPAARARIEGLLFGTYYREFEESIAPQGERVPLVIPPSFE